MASIFSLTSIDGVAAKPHVVEQLGKFAMRIAPSNVEAAARPYEGAQDVSAPAETGCHQEIVDLDLQLNNRPTSSESTHSQHSCSLGSASIRNGPRLSLGSMNSVPSSVLEDEAAIWPGQQNRDHGSAGQSSTSSHVDFPDLIHNDSKDGGKKPIDGSCSKDSKHLGTLVPASPSPLVITNHSTDTLQTDIESLRHRRLLNEMRHFTSRQKFVIVIAVIVALVAAIAMIFMLSFQDSKKMARAAFTGSLTVIFFCLSAVLWAAERTMVETLIAMNIVVVYGIFLNGQIDVWLSYETTR
ncbi:hypothetical protein FKW77_010268 [Venturia effusa]|uniref:Uncharacterized protein n=1 Tax=Venturia effusa TaxID=50376 RepID=A0A517L2A1_9PEZI|nr:hypothetical protein FKW77_010268 [Venturia effusa]